MPDRPGPTVRSRLFGISCAAALSAGALLFALGTPAGAEPIDVPFNVTGASVDWPVPAGICQLNIDASGGQGGASTQGLTGGMGGRAVATITVTPGEVLHVSVGAAGTAGGVGPGQGGFPDGGNSTAGANAFAGGGGGSSDVRQGGTAVGNRVVVAGGGGGSAPGFLSPNVVEAQGGAGGGTTGADGAPGVTAPTPATGGTQSTFGAGGAGTGDSGSPGGQPDGGDAGASGLSGGAGGGGGYWGGGGGAAGNGAINPSRFGGGGGGGGSGFTPDGSGLTQGFQTGDGRVIITYDPASATNAACAAAAAISATPDFTG